MHIALNGWFWDQPFTGSGQYTRELVRALWRLRRTESAFDKLAITLVLPKRPTAPDNVPDGVTIEIVSVGSGQLGKVWFEQRAFPAACGRLKADIAHVLLGRAAQLTRTDCSDHP